MITEDHFRKATGRDPVNDDLDRSNCPDAGKIGHWQCGWDYAADRPIYETGSDVYRREVEIPDI